MHMLDEEVAMRSGSRSQLWQYFDLAVDPETCPHYNRWRALACSGTISLPLHGRALNKLSDPERTELALARQCLE